MLPSFRLYERVRLVASLYPERMESLLDIGSCKGYYVLSAADRPYPVKTVGIDVYEPFVSVANKVKKYLGGDNASFYSAALEEVSNTPEAHGGPFQTVLLIGTYHYLFWGSTINSNALCDHQKIFKMLSKVCTERLIFSARLEVDSLTSDTKEKARMFGGTLKYDTEHILKSAEEFFEVHRAGYLGKFPLFSMSKKKPRTLVDFKPYFPIPFKKRLSREVAGKELLQMDNADSIIRQRGSTF